MTHVPEGKSLSVVVPVYANAGSLIELHARLAKALGKIDFEIIFVNDQSPDNAKQIITSIQQRDTRVRSITLPKNSGQHRAALKGFGEAQGEIWACMDGDLQDTPELLGVMLGKLDKAPLVFATRRGAYQHPGRMLSSWIFKGLLHGLTGLPKNAGMYFAVKRDVFEPLLKHTGPFPYVTVMLAHAKTSIETVEMKRLPRQTGRSAYTSRKRVKAALTALMCWRDLQRSKA